MRRYIDRGTGMSTDWVFFLLFPFLLVLVFTDRSARNRTGRLLFSLGAMVTVNSAGWVGAAHRDARLRGHCRVPTGEKKNCA